MEGWWAQVLNGNIFEGQVWGGSRGCDFMDPCWIGCALGTFVGSGPVSLAHGFKEILVMEASCGQELAKETQKAQPGRAFWKLEGKAYFSLNDGR